MRILIALVVAAALCTATTAVANAAPPPPAESANAEDTASPDAVVLRALQAGLAGKFEKYLEELPADRKETAEQRSQLQRYEWKRFSGQAAWYVADPQKPSFTVARRQATGDSRVKLFIKDLKNKESMPRPIELTRSAGRWWISANSL